MSTPYKFIPYTVIWNGGDEIEVTSSGAVTTFDKPRQNPNPEYKYLIRVGGGFQAFRTRREAMRFYNESN